MSGYSELVRNFNRIRELVREFYIFGFRTRDNYDVKSNRTYDNEKRRIESWLSDYIHTEFTGHKKKVAVKIDSSHIYQNPLYECYKAKSYTDNDIKLHFILLDLLSDSALSVSDITDRISSEYGMVFDVQTVRLKLREYVEEGLITQKKSGKTYLFTVNGVCSEDIMQRYPLLKDMTVFFSEEVPFGVVGNFIMNKTGIKNKLFTRKHFYMVHTLDDEILLSVFDAMKNKPELFTEL